MPTKERKTRKTRSKDIDDLNFELLDELPEGDDESIFIEITEDDFTVDEDTIDEEEQELEGFPTALLAPETSKEVNSELMGHMLISLGSFLGDVGRIIWASPRGQKKNEAVAKTLLLEDFEELKKKIQKNIKAKEKLLKKWKDNKTKLKEKYGDEGYTRRMKKAKKTIKECREVELMLRELMALIKICTRPELNKALNKLAALMRGDAGDWPEKDWPKPKKDAEDVRISKADLQDMLTRLLEWGRLIKIKNKWIKKRKVKFEFRIVGNEVLVFPKGGDKAVSGYKWTIHPDQLRTKRRREQVKKLIEDLNKKFNRCDYPSGGDIDNLRRLGEAIDD